jgi:hypothetical protein
MIIVHVTRVNIPPMSTIGYGEGWTDQGQRVSFMGDHRPMRYLGEALRDADEEPIAIVEPEFILSIEQIQ